VSGFVIPALLAAPLLAAAFWPAQASAAFSVCNKTAHQVAVALGYFDGADWSSSGWWMVEAGRCAELVKEDLPARYYYLYAADRGDGGAWDGDRSFCVAQGRFNIQGRGDCARQGYQVKKFFQVDTGQSIDWTENLAD
jgi:uncharacterized membrane protein